ncbi:MAG: hypothetical protein JKY84_02765 [Emcibacteraceae bacterium]|nr:hypothetical protein [Emcibacteraceae bacterium]
MEGILVPIGFFAVVAFCFWSFYHYKNREKDKIQNTICKAIDAGQQLNPDTIKALGIQSVSAPFSDLRKSILSICFGIAFICFAQVIPDDEATEILSGIAAFPIVLGLGYFIVYRLGLKEPN